MIVGIVVVVLVLAAIPLASKLMQEDGGAAEQSAEPSASGSTSTAAPAPAAVAQPGLDAASLTNTKWAMKVEGFDVTFTLLPGGQALAESPLLGQKQVQGSWSVNGANVTVSVEVGGKAQSATAVISGNSLLVNGQPITRLQ